MKKLPTLYKLDSKGKTREWNIIVDADSFWTEAGIVGMKMNTAKPTICKGKNIGRSNETSPEQQAEAEAQAKWDKKRKDGYTQDLSNVKQKKFYEPMLAQSYDDRKSELKFPCYSQAKLDGVRCIVSLENDEVVARTRNGREIDTIPHVLNKLKGFFMAYPESILDGELYNHAFKEDFNKIISLVRKQKPVRSASDTDKTFLKKQEKFNEALKEGQANIQYWIYDAPRIDNAKENVPFSIRYNYIQNHIKPSDSIKIVETLQPFDEANLTNIYEQYVSEGFEGQMIRVDSPYENKRSKNLLKRKDFKDAEYLVVGMQEGDGNRTGTAKHLICKDEKRDKVFHSNIKGNFEYLKEILDNKEQYIGKYATIKYFQLTPDGVPRFPYAIAFRDYE